jgi:hypothetical protein
MRKGKSGSYWDQHFGAGDLTWFKIKKIDEAITIAATLLMRVVADKDRAAFLENALVSVGPKHVYESWNRDTPDRPNESQ